MKLPRIEWLWWMVIVGGSNANTSGGSNLGLRVNTYTVSDRLAFADDKLPRIHPRSALHWRKVQLVWLP